MPLCAGLYACKGFSAPNKQRGASKYQLIELTDNATLRFKRGKVRQQYGACSYVSYLIESNLIESIGCR